MSLAASYPPAPSRIASLDILRGLAVAGILVISIHEFGGFTVNEQLYYQTGTHGGNYTLMTIVSVLFEGKLRALLAFVFGAGIILYLRKMEKQSLISAGDAYIRRMLWLILFGLVDGFLLLWPGDILFQYGVVGILLYAFNRMKGKGLLMAAILCTLVYCGKQYWNYSDDRKDYKKYLAVKKKEDGFKQDSVTRARKDSANRTGDTVKLKDILLANKLADSLAKKNDTLTSEQAGQKEKWEGIVKGLKYDAAATKATNTLMRSNCWPKIAYQQMMKTQQKESYWLYRTGIWDIASMMLLGMALFSLGFFGQQFPTSRYLVMALAGIAAGIFLAWLRIHLQSIRLTDYGNYIDAHEVPYNQYFPIERMVLALGYASLVLWFLRMHVFGFVWKAFSTIGRMALTNYLLQTIICSIFFFGYGFGFFGRLKQWELYFFVAEVTLVQLVFSVLWQRFYLLGPAEWLWRCLVYRKWLPNRRGES